VRSTEAYFLEDVGVMKDLVGVAATSATVILYLAILLPTVSAATVNYPSDVTISTDKPSYVGNATIYVSGVVPEAKEFDVTVTIASPGHAVITTAGQTTDEDTGGFTVSFSAGGATWSQAGAYVATVIFPGQVFISANTTFKYAPVRVTSSQSSTTSVQATNPSAALPIASIAVAAAIILAVGFVAFRMRSRRGGHS
jgi:hypothetical protein